MVGWVKSGTARCDDKGQGDGKYIYSMYIKVMHTVIETPTFQRTARMFWDEEDIAEFVEFIATNALHGDVMPGRKSLRKLRWRAPVWASAGAQG